MHRIGGVRRTSKGVSIGYLASVNNYGTDAEVAKRMACVWMVSKSVRMPSLGEWCRRTLTRRSRRQRASPA